MNWDVSGLIIEGICGLVERFHLTYVFHYGLDWEHVTSIDDRLAKVNCKLCLLEINETDMEQRIILDQDVGWQKYIHRFGNTNSEIVGYYKNQQDLLLGLLKRTKLEWLKINTSETKVEEALSQTIIFWQI